MPKTLTGLATLALAGTCLGSSVTYITPDVSPFALAGATTIEFQIDTLALSGDGSTVYGSYIETIAGAAPGDSTGQVVPWRFRSETGFTTLDLGEMGVTPDAVLFQNVTMSGAYALFAAPSSQGDTNGVWTPNGPASGQSFTGGAFTTGVRAISGDGTTALREDENGFQFQTWSEVRGVETLQWNNPAYQARATLISDDGQGIGGIAYSSIFGRSAIWTHDPQRGYVVYDESGVTFDVAHMTTGGTALLGERTDNNDPSNAQAFIWEIESGFQSLTPNTASSGRLLAATGDASIIAHEYITPGGELVERLYTDEFGDLPLDEGLILLGYDPGLITNLALIAFSDDGTTLLGIDRDAGNGAPPVLITAGVPAPAAIVLFAMAPLMVTARRRRR